MRGFSCASLLVASPHTFMHYSQGIRAQDAHSVNSSFNSIYTQKIFTNLQLKVAKKLNSSAISGHKILCNLVKVEVASILVRM